MKAIGRHKKKKKGLRRVRGELEQLQVRFESRVIVYESRRASEDALPLENCGCLELCVVSECRGATVAAHLMVRQVRTRYCDMFDGPASGLDQPLLPIRCQP